MRRVITCPICSGEFTPIRKNSVYCSLACFNKNRIQKVRSGVKEPKAVPLARWIPLTQGKFTLVDESDYDDVSRFNWCAVKVKSGHGIRYYAKRTDVDIYLHVYLLNPPSGMEVDHMDDSLDNRRSNLRIVNRSRNQMNRYSNGGTSKYKGISKHTLSKKWAVCITASGRSFHLGYFEDEIEAAKAYDKAARVYHGSQARFNFPEPGERSAVREDGNNE